MKNALRARSGEDAYRCIGLTRLPLSPGLELVQSGLGLSAVVPEAVAEILAGCLAFRTLPEHARASQSFLVDPSRVPDMIRLLESLAHAGFLVALREIVGACNKAARARETPAAIETVALQAWTPEELGRMLSRGLSASWAHDRYTRFLVMGDWDDDRTLHKARNHGKASARHSAVSSIVYAGPRERRCLANRIVAASGVPADVVRFALFGSTGAPTCPGSNGNLVALATAGGACLVADSMMPDAIDPKGESASDSSDVLALHELLLGRRAVDCVASAAGEVDLNGADSAALRELMIGGGYVRITRRGVDVESGIPRAGTGEGGPYRIAIHRTPGRWGPAIALDNRELLPPFVPIPGGEDLYEMMMVRTLPDGWIGQISCGATLSTSTRRHRSTARRHRREAALIVDVLETLCGCFTRPPSGRTEEDLSTLGRHLVEAASCGRAEFVRRVRTAVVRQWEGAKRAPVEQGWDAGRPNPALAQFFFTRNSTDGRHANVFRHIQWAVRQTGRLLCAWPRMVAAARQNRDGDLFLSERQPRYSQVNR
jgi:hypothetical protein